MKPNVEKHVIGKVPTWHVQKVSLIILNFILMIEETFSILSGPKSSLVILNFILTYWKKPQYPDLSKMFIKVSFGCWKRLQFQREQKSLN